MYDVDLSFPDLLGQSHKFFRMQLVESNTVGGVKQAKPDTPGGKPGKVAKAGGRGKAAGGGSKAAKLKKSQAALVVEPAPIGAGDEPMYWLVRQLGRVGTGSKEKVWSYHYKDDAVNVFHDKWVQSTLVPPENGAPGSLTIVVND